MKRYFYLILLLPLVSGCGKSEKERNNEMAAQLLKQARQELSNKQYNNARATIQAIRTNYPTAFDARAAAILTLDSVELMEARDSLVILGKAVKLEEEKFAPLEQSQNHRGRNVEYFEQKKQLFHVRQAYDEMEMKVKFYLKKIEEDKKKQR